jgi:hypothetical protein
MITFRGIPIVWDPELPTPPLRPAGHARLRGIEREERLKAKRKDVAGQRGVRLRRGRP